MNKFTFSCPTKVYFGEGSAIEALREELEEVGSRVMLAYGGGSIKRNGIYNEIKALLVQAGKDVVDFGGIMPNPVYTKVQEGAALARKEKVDFILAVGGGSVISCCKAFSAQAMLDEDIWELEYEKHRIPIVGIPMGAVVTASGTGTEMNAEAVITHEEKRWKGCIWGTRASFAILDPAYTMTVPPQQVLSGAFATLSLVMETYMGNSGRDHGSDDMALALMRNVVVNVRRILINNHDVEARSNLMWDAAMAGSDILKCGSTADLQAH